MAILNLLALLLYTGFNNLYIYELFYGSWEYRLTKGFFYFFTSIFVLFLIVGEGTGYRSNREFQTNLICKITLLACFIIFAFTQLDIFMPKPRMYFLSLNGSVFAISIIILISGLRHDYFKD